MLTDYQHQLEATRMINVVMICFRYNKIGNLVL
jgi:hypothetical protein